MSDLPWRRVVLWGATYSLDSLRHIYRAYADAFRRLGADVAWVAGEGTDRTLIESGCLVFATNVWGDNLGGPINGVDYLLHNFDGSHPVFDRMDMRRLVRLQVWTNDADGETWGPARSFQHEGHVLFQPWGTNLDADDFLKPTFVDNHEAVFVGAVWDDRGMGNRGMIEELTQALARRRIQLKVRTQVSDEEMVDLIRSARLAPAFTGAWQAKKDYLPCRVFKNVSYGQAALTNVPKFCDLFGDVPGVYGDSIEDRLDDLLALDRDEYLELVTWEQQVVANYTYRDSIETVVRAFEEVR